MIWPFPEVFAPIVPEIRFFGSHRERSRVWRSAMRQHGGWSFIVAPILLITPILLLSILSAELQWLSREERSNVFFWAMLIAILLQPWLAVRLMQHGLRRTLRRELLDQGVRVCPACGHDMRGCSASQCPECGGELPSSRITTPSTDPPPLPRAQSGLDHPQVRPPAAFTFRRRGRPECWRR